MGRILVTGATGFTGSHVAMRLRDAGAEVEAWVRPTSDTRALEAAGIDCQVVDITSREAVARAYQPFDKIFHIAAAYRTEHADHDEFYQVNVESTRNLLDAAKEHGVGRFVHCSTVGVQGEIEDPPAAEDYRMQPGDHYQDSKRDGELLALEYFRAGLPGSVVRPVGIYGPGDGRFLKLVKGIDRGRFVMIGSGETLYHMTFIDDLVDGFLLASERPEALGEVFTICGPRYTTLNELCAITAEVLGKKPPRIRIPLWPVMAGAHACEAICRPLGISPPLYPRRVEFFKLSRAFTSAKAERLIGYAPKIDLHEGLARTAAAYRDAGLL